MGCVGTVPQRRPLKSPEPLQGRLATRPISRLISPVARCPEVGGKEQVAGLWNIIKPLQSMCLVFRDSCQILALEIIFQVFLLEKGFIWRIREGGNTETRKE